MDHLYILWTNDQLETAKKMVFMYGKIPCCAAGGTR